MRAFDLGLDAWFGLHQFLQYACHCAVFVQRLALARRHGLMPLGMVLALLDFSALNPTVARIGVNMRFFSV